MEADYFPRIRMDLTDKGYLPGTKGKLYPSDYAQRRDRWPGVQGFPITRGPKTPIVQGKGYNIRDTHIVIRPQTVLLAFGTDIQVLTDLTQAQWHDRFEATGPGYVVRDLTYGGTYFIASISFDLIGPISQN